jgi:hypothetical protein
MIDAGRDEKYQAIRAPFLARRARMVRRFGVRTVPALSRLAAMQVARVDGRRVLCGTTNPPILSAEPLLLNP